jgi:hypothetical protein
MKTHREAYHDYNFPMTGFIFGVCTLLVKNTAAAPGKYRNKGKSKPHSKNNLLLARRRILYYHWFNENVNRNFNLMQSI